MTEEVKYESDIFPIDRDDWEYYGWIAGVFSIPVEEDDFMPLPEHMREVDFLGLVYKEENGLVKMKGRLKFKHGSKMMICREIPNFTTLAAHIEDEAYRDYSNLRVAENPSLKNGKDLFDCLDKSDLVELQFKTDKKDE